MSLLAMLFAEEEAKKAISRLAKQAGFRDHLGGFQCEPYELNKDHWTEGFVTVVTDAQH